MFVLLLLGLLTQAPEARGAVRNLGCIACEKVVQELAGFGEVRLQRQREDFEGNL